MKISSLQEVERQFSEYLQNLSKTANSQGVGRITERKLTVVPHNTWRQIGQPCFISLTKDHNTNAI